MTEVPVSTAWSLTVLGYFSLVADGGDVSGQPRKTLALVTLLALRQGRPISRELAADMLWTHSTPEQAQQGLRQALYQLRRKTGKELIQAENGMLSIPVGRMAVDALAFQERVASSDRHEVARAIDAYQGELLADIGAVSPRFDEWLTAERLRFDTMAGSGLRRLATMCVEAGDFEGAVAAARRLVSMDDLREDSHILLIEMLAQSGRRTDAMRQYDACAALLKRELDIDPDSRMLALSYRLRSEGVAPEATVPGATRTRPDARYPPLLPASAADRPHTRSWRMAAAAAAMALTVAAGVGGTALWTGHGAKPRALASIAVLPLAPSNPADQAVADAITEDLTSYLTNSQLQVAPRTSVSQYRGQPIDIASVGEKLGVRYAVEGTVRTEGDRLRVNVDLIDTASRASIWADTFEESRDKTHSLEGEIAKRLARELNVEADIALSHQPAHTDGSDPALEELLAKGRTARLQEGWTPQSLADALGWYEKALGRDPHSVPAMLGVANVLMVRQLQWPTATEVADLARAGQLLTAAVQAAPQSSMMAYNWGIYHRAADEDALSLEDFERAVQLDPSFSVAYGQIGMTLLRLGRAQEELEKIEYALTLSPNDAMLRYLEMVKGAAELELGDYQAALASERRAYALNLRVPRVHAFLAATYALLGDRQSAISQFSEVRRLETQFGGQPTLSVCREKPRLPHYNTGLCQASAWSNDSDNPTP